MKKLFVFDLDGTLVNSIYDLGDAMNAVLERYGFSVFGYDTYKHFVGNGTLKLVERALPEDMRSEENIKKYHAEFSEEYNKRCLNKTKPYEHICEVLEMLRGEGIMTAVASNKPDGFVNYIVKNIFGEKDFDLIVGKKDGVPTKPAPDIIYNILDMLGVSAKDAVLIGDSDVDVITAKNAGLDCIGCVWGFRGREELENAGAKYIAEVPHDIVSICHEINRI